MPQWSHDTTMFLFLNLRMRMMDFKSLKYIAKFVQNSLVQIL